MTTRIDVLYFFKTHQGKTFLPRRPMKVTARSLQAGFFVRGSSPCRPPQPRDISTRSDPMHPQGPPLGNQTHCDWCDAIPEQKQSPMLCPTLTTWGQRERSEAQVGIDAVSSRRTSQ
jgi:hypothetical protein